MARFDARKVERLLRDPGIVRHRGKIESAIRNARRVREIVAEFGSLAAYVWQFEPPERERPRRPTWPALRKLTESPSSRALAADLKRRGLGFVGPTTMYAYLQSVGVVNDHVEGCEARERAEAARRRFRRPRPRR